MAAVMFADALEMWMGRMAKLISGLIEGRLVTVGKRLGERR